MAISAMTAEEHEGLLTASLVRESGISNSALSRLAGRGRLERTARGVYRLPYYPLNRLSQYREAVLALQAHRGPANVAISHETALVAYGVSDANPAAIHLTVPRRTRLRRVLPKGLELHRADLAAGEIFVHEGLPLTTIERTIADLLADGGRLDIVRQAIAGARKEGFISGKEAHKLRVRLQRYVEKLKSNDQHEAPTAATAR